MIVLTNGQTSVMTFQDGEWNDSAKYADHASNGITNGFRCHPKYGTSVLSEANTSIEVEESNDSGSAGMTHDEVAAIALEEVSISNEYT
jgi:hypothetical protein